MDRTYLLNPFDRKIEVVTLNANGTPYRKYEVPPNVRRRGVPPYEVEGYATRRRIYLECYGFKWSVDAGSNSEIPVVRQSLFSAPLAPFPGTFTNDH